MRQATNKSLSDDEDLDDESVSGEDNEVSPDYLNRKPSIKLNS